MLGLRIWTDGSGELRGGPGQAEASGAALGWGFRGETPAGPGAGVNQTGFGGPWGLRGRREWVFVMSKVKGTGDPEKSAVLGALEFCFFHCLL